MNPAWRFPAFVCTDTTEPARRASARSPSHGVADIDVKKPPVKEAWMTGATKVDLARVFYALSDPIRLKVIRLLAEGELCVCDLMAALEMAQSKVSFHMAVLKSAGLVASRRVGRWNAYALSVASGANTTLFDMVPHNRSVSVTAEKKKLRAYVKCKKRHLPKASGCCPEEPIERGCD